MDLELEELISILDIQGARKLRWLAEHITAPVISHIYHSLIK
jgi:hypothetical protein